MPSKLSQEDFITRCTKIHKGYYNYSKTVYSNRRSDICIICPVHGEFNQKADTHIKGSGCFECSLLSRRLSTEDFIKRSSKIHKGVYDYTKTVYAETGTKVVITCKTHGDFLQSPSNHLQGFGCLKCQHDKSRLGLDSFIAKSNKIHGGIYDYSLIDCYINNKTKLSIICPKHGKFEQTAADHLKGGCEACSYELRSNSSETFIKKATDKHGSAYKFVTVNYTNGDSVVEVICSHHGSSLNKASNILEKNHACNYCAKESSGWTLTSWKKSSSIKNNSAYVYIIEGRFEGTDFIKIGRTVNIRKRLRDLKCAGVTVKSCHYLEGPPEVMYKMEYGLHRLYKQHSIEFTKKFGGYTECYNVCIFEDVMSVKGWVLWQK